MAYKYTTICDNCNQETENDLEWVKVTYESTVRVIRFDCVGHLESVKKTFNFCCDDCAKVYIYENGFKKL